MPMKSNGVLAKMLERLFAALVNGPSLNCRPHASRQRIDLVQFGKLKDIAAEEVLRTLLGPDRHAKVTAKAPAPKRRKATSDAPKSDENVQPAPDPLTPEEKAVLTAWEDQELVFRKLRVIVDDARTYEQDTGVHVLSIGFPLLSLPPNSFKAAGGSLGRRIIAPIAFVPVSVTVRQGAGRSVEIRTRGEGGDLVVPNTALLAWLQQQTGQDLSDVFADEKGEAPWKEVREITHVVAKLAGVKPAAFLAPAEDAPDGEPAHLPLVSAPRGDDESEGSILPTAVLGLFPMANQGLLRDTQEMAGETLTGPIGSFLRHDALLDAAPPPVPADEPVPAPHRGRVFTKERLVAAADPSQSRAVRLARDCPGLVIHGPPGTGKSQTITNIIGDHLWRGQRVLVVCDKRTALDVVIDRLDRLGLRNLCALVYDPQRDRRELYKRIRQQLDDLPDVKTDPRAQREVDRLDAELQKLHDELTAYTSALSAPDESTGLSFHAMVGQWLAASADELPDVEPKLTASITLEMLRSHEQDVREILDRATDAEYPRNPWKDAWGLALADYLARPMAEIRQSMANCVTAAREADATAHPSIPAFDPQVPLDVQSAARKQLAADLRELLARADASVLAALSNQEAKLFPLAPASADGSAAPPEDQGLASAQRKLADVGSGLTLIQEHPLEAALLDAALRDMPTAAAASESLGTIDAYIAAFRQWSGRYRHVASACPSVSSATILYWLSKDSQAVSRAAQRLADLGPIVQTVAAGRLDRSLWLQFQRQPFDLAQAVQWLGTLNAYLEVASKWYAFLKPGPRKQAAPVAQFFGLALTPQTAVQLRDFLTGLRARLELKADLEDGLIPQALPPFPADEDLLAAHAGALAAAGATASGQSADAGPTPPPELITPLLPAQAQAAAPLLSHHGIGLDLASAVRLSEFLTGLHARLRCVETLRSFSIPFPAALPDDARLRKTMEDASAAVAFLLKLVRTPALNCVRGRIAQCMSQPSAAPPVIEGLERSPARVTAVLKLLGALAGARLIRDGWIAAADQRLRKGSLSVPTVQALADRIDTLEAVLRVAKGLDALPQIMRRATAALVQASAPGAKAIATLRRAALSAEITARLQGNPKLHELDGQRMKSCFERYRALDAQKREAVRDATLHEWAEKQKGRLLAATGTRLNSVGAELRRRLTIQGDRAMRLRQVIALGSDAEGGDPLFDLCPVWMASPETVAQLFPRQPIFDVVIFDEASQCRLEEALPVLTRAKRVVIAGDPQQLPPTRFFESAVAESADEEIESDQQLFETRQGEIEDLLAAALNLEIEQSYLDVHYRSRNSDLIQFSNRHFYNSRLQPIPGHPLNRARFAPVTLYRADGTYEKRANEQEAERVCEIVSDLLKRSEPPSIGIACFNLPQRDLIVEKLEERALEDPTFGKRLASARQRQGAGSSESLFVKNLENVQGDERDHIIISTTYGPDPSGRFHRRFGPVGRLGGGRRLNVLVTRARQEVHLVTSVPPEVYRALPPVPAGQAPSGAWLLFAYLAYAERLAELYDGSHAPDAEPAALPPAQVNLRPTRTPSAFAEAFAGDLKSKRNIGSDVHWGNDGFCIDMALHHPARPGDVTIGVLCDGSRFALAEDPVEWDVFRTGVLQDQGWALHRVWTPHFFRDPEGSSAAVARGVEEFLASEAPSDSLRVS